MRNWSDESVMIQTPYGRMTRNLAPLIAEYEAKRAARRETASGTTATEDRPRVCPDCGQEFGDCRYDCCMRPQCQTGQENLTDAALDGEAL
jgi:hypothetical protein